MNAMFLIVIDIFMRFSRFGEEQVDNTIIGFFYYMTTLFVMLPLAIIFIWYEIEVRNKIAAEQEEPVPFVSEVDPPVDTAVPKKKYPLQTYMPFLIPYYGKALFILFLTSIMLETA